MPTRTPEVDRRLLGVERDHVLVHRDAGLAERLLGDLAGELLGAQVDQHQVVVGAARARAAGPARFSPSASALALSTICRW